MKLQNLHISNVGCIENLSLHFNEKMNIICGPNGVGKTTILDAISGISIRSYATSNLRKKFGSENGIIEYTFFSQDYTNKFIVENDSPQRTCNINSDTNLYNIIHIGTQREFFYNAVEAIPKQEDYSNYHIENAIGKGAETIDNKKWLLNRLVYEHIPNALTSIERKNIAKVKEFFSLMDKRLLYKTVTKNNDIFVTTPFGDFEYEALSSGLKSTLAILLSIAREIEYLNNPTANIAAYDGLILIDELELHLHPSWQVKLFQAMPLAFPNAQFIITTHSPHIIQVAEPNSIIPLIDVDGKIQVRDIPSPKYGFQGWRVEEILTDVMGMETTLSPMYEKKLNDFKRCIDDGRDIEKINDMLEDLREFFHPDNPIVKVLEINMAGLRTND